MDRRARAGAALIAFAVVVPRLSGLYTTNIFDDAFITFRYSENLVRGHGLVYNPGLRTLGTTTPLFALILAGGRFAGVSVPAAALLIGVASDVASALLLYSLVRRELGTLAAALAVLFFAADPHVIRVSVGGMESSLFLAVSLFLIDRLLQGRAALAFPIASASLYLRPEGIILWAASGALLLRQLVRGGQPRRAGMAALALGLAITLVPVALMHAYYGSPAPQSVISKTQKVGGSLYGVLEVFFFPPGSPGQTLLTLLALPGVILAWGRSRFATALAVWLAVYVAAYAAARPHMWTWYGLPVYCGKAIFAGVTAAAALRRLRLESPLLARRALGGAAALCLVSAAAMAAVAGYSPVRRHVYQPLQAWCAEHVKGGDTIAAGDVGAVGFYCDAFIYDLAGLVWADRAQFEDHLAVVEAKKPDYIFAELSRYWSSLYDPASPLRVRYRPLRRFSPEGRQELDLRPSALAPAWQKDYMLFERVDRPAVAESGRPAAP